MAKAVDFPQKAYIAIIWKSVAYGNLLDRYEETLQPCTDFPDQSGPHVDGRWTECARVNDWSHRHIVSLLTGDQPIIG